MRDSSLIQTLIVFACALSLLSCGAKGDPAPRQRRPPAPCAVRAIGLRTLEVVLPLEDIQGNSLSGIEAVRVYYLPLGAGYPMALEVFQQGEVILERRRPNLPSPGKTIILDLSNHGRPSGWLTVVAFCQGNIPGEPSQAMPWLDPAF